MPKKLNTVLGIDIGSQQIKIAEVKMQGREPAITALNIGPTPEGTVDSAGVYDSDAVAAAVKSLAADAGASAPFAVVSIAGQASVLVRTLEVPKMTSDELKETMNYEISRNIPFAESTIESDYRAYPNDDPNSPNMDVVMAIAPQSAIQTMIQVVTKSGRKPHAIDVEPLGLARSAMMSYGGAGAGKTMCVVDMGHNTTSINMYKDGQLMMPRQVPIGGYHITRALVDNLGINEAEAETLKQSRASVPNSAGIGGGYGTPAAPAYDPFASDPAPTMQMPAANPYAEPYAADVQADQTTGEFVPPPPVPDAAPTDDVESTRIYNAMAAILEEFYSELRRSIDYYRSKGGDVDSIYLCGGGAKLRGLSEYLERMIGLKVQDYDPLKGLSLSGRRLDMNQLDSHRSEFAIAVGNALHIAFD
ncbi:MAG: type IV pilus assembly protein PilM [Chthonomonas sp.]|nr:type IV pilus assembly protein PilM [Chthonomonas sp.]